MPELGWLVKLSIFLYFLCTVAAIVIYFSPLWKKICDRFDDAEAEAEAAEKEGEKK